MDVALAKLAEGAAWDDVMAEYTDDPGMQGGSSTAVNGYAVCEGFTSFDAPFVTAAMGIQEKGKWSEPTAGAYGYYIIQYVDDVVEGPVDLAEVHDTLQSELLTEKQDAEYSAKLEQWVSEATWVINKDALND